MQRLIIKYNMARSCAGLRNGWMAISVIQSLDQHASGFARSAWKAPKRTANDCYRMGEVVEGGGQRSLLFER
jgi:hypothetical protein